MATSKKKVPVKKTKTSVKQQNAKKIPISKLKILQTYLLSTRKKFISRRPHRSFKLTRRRDYTRTLKLVGYWAFTFYVWKLLWSHKRLFGGVLIVYTLLNALFVGLSSQESYTQLSKLIQDTGSDLFSGGWGEVGQAGLLLLSGVSGSFTPQLTDVQQVYAFLFLLLTWLTTVWLLRGILAGARPKLRDAIYNSGSPIVPTGIVLLVMFVQLVPLALAAIVVNVGISTGFVSDGGAVAMLLWIVVSLLAILSLYWISSTIVALVVVTLPGMYPWQAIKTAGDLVIGRRIRILLRLMWLLLSSVVIWVIIVLPTIIVETNLRKIIPFLGNVPVVPTVIAVITSFAVVWSAAYIYLLYRKVVEDDAEPA